jgi:hypothetical protein
MAHWKRPPRAKVYEALAALADGRVHLGEDGTATVLSSGLDKTYEVEWSPDGTSITSNDNASYWQSYTGYPILAVLIAIGRIRVDQAVTPALAGIDWHGLNKRFHRDYDAAVAHVLREIELHGLDTEPIERQVDDVMSQLAGLNLERPARVKRPPKGR